MVGYDVLIYPGLDSRLKATEEDVITNARTCLAKMGDLKTTLPVPAGSQWAGSLENLYKMLGTYDFGIVPGRAVFGHPMGPLQLADFIGLDVCLAILNVMYDGFKDPKFRPCPLLVNMVTAGHLGDKTGKGFYAWEKHKVTGVNYSR